MGQGSRSSGDEGGGGADIQGGPVPFPRKVRNATLDVSRIWLISKGRSGAFRF
jgi:hypothetical protein